MQDWLYLDNSASTPMAPSVVEAMCQALDGHGHPGSSHPHGQRAAQEVQRARGQVARALACTEDEIVFCSGATEACNFVLKGVAFSAPKDRTLHFVSSVVDHPAILKPLEFLERLGHRVTLLPVDRQGRLSLSELRRVLREQVTLVSVIHGQNETGTLQAAEEIAQLCRDRGALLHLDASQSFGKVPFQAPALGVDFLTIAGHKIHGPKGVGALFIKAGHRLEPLLHGGGQESGFRSGTPAPQLLSGLGEACRLVTELGPIPGQATEQLWELLQQKLGPQVRRNGHPDSRLPNVLHLTFQGVVGRELLQRSKISGSTGSACHGDAASPTLLAMGFSPDEAAGSVRLSCGRQSDLKLVEEAAARLTRNYQILKDETKA